MEITREYNHYRGSNFVVERVTRKVEDSGIRITIQMQISRCLKKIQTIKTLRKKTLELIRFHQLKALTTDNNREVIRLTEYIDQILMVDLHRHDREIKALELQLEKLRARL